jgi:endonuclease/exonuclease/phosphatase family metal-dependent hydrolase
MDKQTLFAKRHRWLSVLCLCVLTWMLSPGWACDPGTQPSDAGQTDNTPAETKPTEPTTTDNTPKEVPKETPTEPPPPTEGTFTAITYNVHGLPSGITKDDTNARLKAIGPLLAKKYQILGLQEVFTDDGYDILKAPLSFPTHYRYDEKIKDRFMGSGLLFLSTFQAVDEKHALFGQCNGTLDGASDCLASKGFQMVRVALAPGVTIDVYNSHFEAGKGDKDKEARTKNLLELRKAMKEWSTGRALMFLGDTNLHEDREGDKQPLADWIKEAQLTDSCEAVNCPKKGRIDRIFFRSSSQLKLTAKSWSIPPEFVDEKGVPLSDHDPIVVEFDWKVAK